MVVIIGLIIILGCAALPWSYHATHVHKDGKDEIIGKLQVNGITAENDFKLLVKHNGAFNPYLTNKNINIEYSIIPDRIEAGTFLIAATAVSYTHLTLPTKRIV